MEFEVLSEEVEWECKRVVAAFGVTGWTQRNLHKESELLFDATGESFRVMWWISSLPLAPILLLAIEVRPPRGREGKATWLTSYESNFQYEVREVGESTRELMARGLYCLCVENQNISDQLPALSAHEKLELRLSMSREFWPQKWFEEEL